MTNIIEKLLIYSGLNAKSFSEKIGLERPQAIYDIQKGKTKNISPSMRDKIISVFPELNIEWLLTGDGEMLKPANPFIRMSEQEMRETFRDTIAEELMKLLKKGEIYLASTHDKIVAEKNEEIAKRDERIDKLQKENWGLQRKIDDLTK